MLHGICKLVRLVRQNLEQDQRGTTDCSGSYHRVASVKDGSGSDKDYQRSKVLALASCLPSSASSGQLQDIDRKHSSALGSVYAKFCKVWSRK